MLSVCPTKCWVFEKGRTPTSGCRAVFISVSPTKYDNSLLVIDLLKCSYCFILTPHYYDSFMICPINSIIFRKGSEWRYYICISEISRIYKVIYFIYNIRAYQIRPNSIKSKLVSYNIQMKLISNNIKNRVRGKTIENFICIFHFRH